MVAANPPGPTGFGGLQGPTNPDFVPFVDSIDGMPVVYPTVNGVTGQISAFAVDPKTVVDTAGLPPQNAILVELRCITNLLAIYLGDRAPDLQQMRAEEIFNTMVGTALVP